eukprot:TRINITY_DN3061_c0_g1_i7.p1 TRINITY_DN3061_c0_g1~~TRINITY_DN3061_c0_g1_i7.p1  ORF type:complete len:406 (-),score=80.03 TRINITY_DN3061_c0_g1_i7:127-1344(-)
MLSPAPWVQRPVAAALTSCATSGSSGSTWAPARLRLLDDQPKYPRRSAHVAAGALLAGGGVVGSMGATLFFGGRRSRTSRRNSKRALQRRAAQGNAEGGVGSSSVGRTTRAAGSACRMMFANNDRCVTLDPSVKQAVEDRLTEYVAGTGKAKDGKYEEAENTVLQSQLQQSDGDLDAAPERAPPRGESGPKRRITLLAPGATPQSLQLCPPKEGCAATAPDQSDEEAPGWLELFRSAAPWVAAYQGGAVVLHLPSFLFNAGQQEVFKSIMEDVAFCKLLGMKIILVSSIENAAERGELECRDSAARLVEAKRQAGYVRVEVESALKGSFRQRAGLAARGFALDGHALAGLGGGDISVSVCSSGQAFFEAAPASPERSFEGIVKSLNVEIIRRRLDDGETIALRSI